MKKIANLFIAWFPVSLVLFQVLGNFLYFVDRPFYVEHGFYLNLFLGTNFYFAIFLLVMTLRLGFCSISVWAAIAELAFAVFYAVIKEDNVYNIVFQITVGITALIITFFHFIQRYPLCMASTWVSLWKHLIVACFKKGSCSKGVERWATEHRLLGRKLLEDGSIH